MAHAPEAFSIILAPAANAQSWNEGYGTYGTSEIDAVAPYNAPDHPMLILFAHDGDNAWSGGYSYYNENVTSFAHAAGQVQLTRSLSQILVSF